MSKGILITGVSGTGKSTVCKALGAMGYESTDIENVEGLFDMYHKVTKNIFQDYNNANPEHIKDAEWLCDVDKLKTFLNSQKSDLAFYAGVASNMDDVLPLFDKVFVLFLSSEALNERLKNREGTEDIGNNQEGRDVILGWKDEWEAKMKKYGAIFVDASRTPQAIAKEISEKC